MIHSIDEFQGRETDIVIFVTVHCNPHGDIGFLGDLRRFNVVMTRARAGFICIGCPWTLKHKTFSYLGSGGPDETACEVRGDNGVTEGVDKDSEPIWRRRW
jgi:regulator of nonsense transcripts 1